MHRDERLQKDQQNARDAPPLVVRFSETANACEQHARILGVPCEQNLIGRVSIPQGCG
jgi:hypothetical protein